MAQFPYPMWAVFCEVDGFVCTVWEKPGTGCSYIEHCPKCGRGPTGVLTVEVSDKDQHEAVMEAESLDDLAFL